MLLKSYALEIFNSECNPSAMSVHCFAHPEQDVGEAIPCLNDDCIRLFIAKEDFYGFDNFKPGISGNANGGHG